jgi:hypothetical protein
MCVDLAAEPIAFPFDLSNPLVAGELCVIGTGAYKSTFICYLLN